MFNDECNPKKYLDDIKDYMSMKNIPEDCKLKALEQLLSGHLKNWFQSNKALILSFERFETLFLEECYSIPVKVALKSKWSERKYNKSNGSLKKCFYSQLNKAQYFDPPLTTYEINFLIIHQMLVSIQIAMSTVNFALTQTVVQSLSQLDIAHSRLQDENNAARIEAEEIFPGWGESKVKLDIMPFPRQIKIEVPQRIEVGDIFKVTVGDSEEEGVGASGLNTVLAQITSRC